MKQNKIYSLLGLAMRGRNLVSGEFQTEDAVKKGSAMLVIVAEDASANTKKLFHDKCSYYEVPASVMRIMWMITRMKTKTILMESRNNQWQKRFH